MNAITRAGATLQFETIGHGRPLVLLHGFTDSKDSWSELDYAAPLVSAGHRLVLVDQRGHGDSARSHEIDAYAAEQRAADIVAVLDHLAIRRADVLGYSMGGWGALNLARYHPERIDRLVVGGCHPFGQSMAFYRDAVAESIERWIGIVERIGRPMSDRWKARMRANDILALRAAVAEDRPDISPHLAGFARPSLFYAGGEDPLRDAARRTADLVAQARYFEVPACNHLSAFLRADLVLPHLLAWLAR